MATDDLSARVAAQIARHRYWHPGSCECDTWKPDVEGDVPWQRQWCSHVAESIVDLEVAPALAERDAEIARVRQVGDRWHYHRQLLLWLHAEAEHWREKLARECEVQRGQLDNKDEEITTLRVELNALKTALRPRLNGLLGALGGQGNKLVDEMRAAIAVLDGECKETPSTLDSSPDNPRLLDIPDSRIWARGALQPAGVDYVRSANKHTWIRDPADNRWWSRTEYGPPSFSWDELLAKHGWVVEAQAGGGQP